MYKYSFFILILIVLLNSCATTREMRRIKRATKKLERLKEKFPDVWDSISTKTVVLDTVIKEVKVEGTSKVIIDTIYIDSLIIKYDTIKDIRTRWRTVLKEIPYIIDIDSVLVDTFDISLFIYYNKEKAEIEYFINRDSIHITKTETVDVIQPITSTNIVKVVPWWVWVLVGIVIIYIYLKLTRK